MIFNKINYKQKLCVLKSDFFENIELKNVKTIKK